MLKLKFPVAIAKVAVVVSLFLVGCSSPDPNSETNTSKETVKTATKDGQGTLKLVANGEDFVRRGFVTKDGWEISFDRVLVTLAEVTAYQTNPPYDPDSGKAIASSTKVVLLEGEKTVDLAEGDANADPIIVAEVSAPVGLYNALTWKVVKSKNGEIDNRAIRLEGKAKKNGNTVDFAIAFDKELSYSCGEFVGEERKGIVKISETAEVEMTFHFDHIFGDAEASANEDINMVSIGFDPLADLAENARLTVDLATLKESLDSQSYQTLEAAIAGLGHVGEGHCSYQ